MACCIAVPQALESTLRGVSSEGLTSAPYRAGREEACARRREGVTRERVEAIDPLRSIAWRTVVAVLRDYQRGMKQGFPFFSSRDEHEGNPPACQTQGLNRWAI